MSSSIDSVDSVIAEVEAVLAATASEDQVLAALQRTLVDLRERYGHDATLFTPAHIARLKELAAMERALDIFVTIRPDFTTVDDLEDLAELRAELVRIAPTLGPSAVRQRVDKEIRELDERKPVIERRTGEREELDERALLNALARNAPRCPVSRHAMRMRGAERGPYWACSAYPHCEHRQWLDRDEKAFLEGDPEATARLELRWHRAREANPLG